MARTYNMKIRGPGNQFVRLADLELPDAVLEAQARIGSEFIVQIFDDGVQVGLWYQYTSGYPYDEIPPD